MRTYISGETENLNNNSKVEFYEVEPCLSELSHSPALNPFKQDPRLITEISRITEAIQEVTWLPYETYKDGPSDVKCFFARMIFSFQCREMGFSPRMITAFINRRRTTILRYLKNYKYEYRYNLEFRELADKVNQKLKNGKTH